MWVWSGSGSLKKWTNVEPLFTENLRRLKNLLKLPNARKWVFSEFFYAEVDQQLFFGDNEFDQCLYETMPNLRCRRMTKPQWRKIRMLIGKPRRCSQVASGFNCVFAILKISESENQWKKETVHTRDNDIKIIVRFKCHIFLILLVRRFSKKSESHWSNDDSESDCSTRVWSCKRLHILLVHFHNIPVSLIGNAANLMHVGYAMLRTEIG